LKDFLAISLAAIVGANLRYLLSRLGAPVRSSVSLRNAFHQHCGQLRCGILRDLDDRARAGRSALETACGRRLIWFVHHVFKLRLRNDVVFERGQWGLMLANISSNNLLCLGSALAGMAVARAL